MQLRGGWGEGEPHFILIACFDDLRKFAPPSVYGNSQINWTCQFKFVKLHQKVRLFSNFLQFWLFFKGVFWCNTHFSPDKFIFSVFYQQPLVPEGRSCGRPNIAPQQCKLREIPKQRIKTEKRDFSTLYAFCNDSYPLPSQPRSPHPITKFAL